MRPTYEHFSCWILSSFFALISMIVLTTNMYFDLSSKTFHCDNYKIQLTSINFFYLFLNTINTMIEN